MSDFDELMNTTVSNSPPDYGEPVQLPRMPHFQHMGPPPQQQPQPINVVINNAPDNSNRNESKNDNASSASSDNTNTNTDVNANVGVNAGVGTGPAGLLGTLFGGAASAILMAAILIFACVVIIFMIKFFDKVDAQHIEEQDIFSIFEKDEPEPESDNGFGSQWTPIGGE